MSDLANEQDVTMVSSTMRDPSSVRGDDSTDERPTAIDSFVPLIQALESSAVQIIDNEYHLRGPVSSESLEKLIATEFSSRALESDLREDKWYAGARPRSKPAVKLTEESPSEPWQFLLIVKTTLATGLQTLNAFTIIGRRKTGENHYQPPALKPYTWDTLLSQSSLRSSEISRWNLGWDLGKNVATLSSPARPSMLESLHLPVGHGIPLSMLHTILKSRPSLISLHCRFIKPSVVPTCPSDNDIYGLKTLGAGSTKQEHYEIPEMMSIVQYIDTLCPSLESIEFEKDGHNFEQQIHNFVKKCQYLRSYHAAARNPVKLEP